MKIFHPRLPHGWFVIVLTRIAFPSEELSRVVIDFITGLVVKQWVIQ